MIRPRGHGQPAINAGTDDTVVLGTATGDNVAENATVVLWLRCIRRRPERCDRQLQPDGTDPDPALMLQASSERSHVDASLDYNSANTHDDLARLPLRLV